MATGRASEAVELLQRAVRYVQGQGSWSGLRIMTPDGFPIYDTSPSHPGAFAVTCHSGVTLAALHALHTAPEIIAGQFTGRYQEFVASRFKTAA